MYLFFSGLAAVIQCFEAIPEECKEDYIDLQALYALDISQTLGEGTIETLIQMLYVCSL